MKAKAKEGRKRRKPNSEGREEGRKPNKRGKKEGRK